MRARKSISISFFLFRCTSYFFIPSVVDKAKPACARPKAILPALIHGTCCTSLSSPPASRAAYFPFAFRSYAFDTFSPFLQALILLLLMPAECCRYAMLSRASSLCSPPSALQHAHFAGRRTMGRASSYLNCQFSFCRRRVGFCGIPLAQSVTISARKCSINIR